jgi:hypothetical protein
LNPGFQKRWSDVESQTKGASQKDFEKRRDEMVQDTYYQGQALKQAFGRLTESIGYGTGLISNALSVSAKAMNDAAKGYWIDNMRQIWGTEVKMWANPHQYRSQDDLGEMDIGSFPGRKDIQTKLADQIRKQRKMEIGALSKLPEGAPEYMELDRQKEITDIKNKNWTIGEEVLNKSSFGDSPDSTIGTMNRTIAEQAVVQRFTQLSDTTTDLIAKFKEWAGIPFNPNGMGGEKPEINVHVEPHVLVDGREIASRIRALNEDTGLGGNQRYPKALNTP